MGLLQQQWQIYGKADTPAKLVIGVFRLPSWSLASACSTQVVGVILHGTSSKQCVMLHTCAPWHRA
jgi:hypothetical protein